MSLVVLKNFGYQEYQNLLSKRAQAIEQQAKSSESPAPLPKLRISKAFRAGLRFTSLSAILFVIFFLTGSYLGIYSTKRIGHDRQASLEQFKTEFTAPVIVRVVERGDSKNGIWKCGKQIFTNAPASRTACEFLGSSTESEGAHGRFITPAAPKDL